MISPVAIALAVAFWAPYSPPGGACPNGVQIHENAQPPVEFATRTDGLVTLAWTQLGTGTCELWASTDLEFEPVPRQCQSVAHEIGHARFGLDHSTDPNDLMYPVMGAIPGICYPSPTRSTSNAHVRTPVPDRCCAGRDRRVHSRHRRVRRHRTVRS